MSVLCKTFAGNFKLNNSASLLIHSYLENSYLNVAVPAGQAGSSTSPQQTKQKPVGELHTDLMDKLESAIKNQISTFCLEAKRLTLHEAIGTGQCTCSRFSDFN